MARSRQPIWEVAMLTRPVRRLTAVAVALVIAAGCSSSDGGDASDAGSDGTSASAATTGDTAADVTAPASTVAEVNILTDFGDVCRGVKLPGATAYDAARTGVHPIMTVAGEPPTYEGAGALLPDQWDPVVGEEQTVELVVCMDRTAATKIDTCTGYQDDAGNDTGNAVELYDAEYTIRVLAATTGDEVATTTLSASDPTCPSFMFFDDDQQVKQSYAEPTDALTAFLAPIVET
jgi:hypothetical protein